MNDEHYRGPHRKAAINDRAHEPQGFDASKVPDAVAAADSRRRLTPLDRANQARGRGIEWVRAQDLLMRGATNTTRVAMDLEQRLLFAARHGIAVGATRAGRAVLPGAQHQAQPFGHGHTPLRPEHAPAGRAAL